MLIDHGTFAQYTPATPNIPPRPTMPDLATPASPEPPAMWSSQELWAAFEAAHAIYETEVAANNATIAAWEAATAAWFEATASARRLKAQLEAGGIFCRNGSAVDWYTIAHASPAPGRRFALLTGDSVVAIATDPSRLWPLGHQVIETDDAAVAHGWRLVDGALVDPATIPPTIEELIAHAAAKRWAKEVGGCVVDGHQVATDRESQAKYLAEFVAMGAGMRADPSPWKFADGEFAVLTNAQMAAVIMGVRAHVTGAFANEMTVVAAITAGTITTKAAVDAAFG